MYDRLLRLYNEGRLSDAGLSNAVAREWISKEEMLLIQSSVE